MSDENKPSKPQSAQRKDPALMTPYERDVACDTETGQPRPEILQAFRDIDSGQLDTDLHGARGVEQAAASPHAVRARQDRDGVTRESTPPAEAAERLEHRERLEELEKLERLKRAQPAPPSVLKAIPVKR